MNDPTISGGQNCAIGRREITLEDYYIPASDEHIGRERSRARDLRNSQWWKRQLAEGLCHYCRGEFRPSELTMDHVVPVVRGGFSKRGNVVPCCKDCNNQKQSMLPVEWNRYLEGLVETDGSHTTDTSS
ncbi:MAG: HNH endonuclease [Gemmatimonadetes bacterium]|jgi:5-methylcytosine-specific restriction enzyme A|nr:HNH endonuclease [Gemmatimonadota bacterium]MBT4609086.1 HNH endonuclease [Gemmatimonadota bacterium]MBT5058015.1 HNH endonuclease [Gemmatimonadota bacterium]MBT5141676.1 HNH endonuclease [Gemmatimonadota bacterium]MBT5590979.1 HNH endonuclease [Gemmatimonadota bacterium]